MARLIKIIPKSPRLVADVAQEARTAQSVVKVIGSRVVMFPRAAANQELPRLA